MSRQYKFHNEESLYFASFAVVYWIDLFVREVYNAIIVNVLNYHIEHKGMKVYGWVIMTSHVHLIFTDTEKRPALRNVLQSIPKDGIFGI